MDQLISDRTYTKSPCEWNGLHMDWLDYRNPSGSVWGPLLFVLFINDLQEINKNHSDVYLFADNTNIFQAIYNEEDCKKLQEDLDAIQNWTNDSLLKFNPDKCKHLHVSTRQEHHRTYLLGPEQHPVQHTSQEKDRGATFDEQLTFEHHLNEKIKNQIPLSCCGYN